MEDDVNVSEKVLIAQIVSAYVKNNHVQPNDLPDLIEVISESFLKIARTGILEPKPEPAVSIRTSIKHDCIICLEDGLRFASMKRHLKAAHDMTPGEYREKWGLPTNYPMVAPAYSSARSELAKSFNFGRRPLAGRKRKKKTG